MNGYTTSIQELKKSCNIEQADNGFVVEVYGAKGFTKIASTLEEAVEILKDVFLVDVKNKDE